MSQGRGPTRSAQMRAWLVENGPSTATAIREGMGLTAKQMKSTLYELVSKGMATHDGGKRPRTYTAGRPAVRDWGVRSAAALAAKQQRQANRRKGNRTKAQIQADAIQKRIDAMTAKLAADNAQRKEQQARIEDNARRRQAVARMTRDVSPPASHDDFPDTEAFIRSNPDKLIRLPPGQWSSPLRFTY